MSDAMDALGHAGAVVDGVGPLWPCPRISGRVVPGHGPHWGAPGATAGYHRLLVEAGFEATTIQAVAERSGLHTSALYRRRPSRIELITFPGLDPPSVHPTGDLHRDLRRFVHAYVAAFDAPAARAASGGLLAHRQTATHAPELYVRVSARPRSHDILAAAPAGTIDPDIHPDDVFDMLLGAIITRTQLLTGGTRHRPQERIVELTLRLLRPPGATNDAAAPSTG